MSTTTEADYRAGVRNEIQSAVAELPRREDRPVNIGLESAALTLITAVPPTGGKRRLWLSEEATRPLRHFGELRLAATVEMLADRISAVCEETAYALQRLVGHCNEAELDSLIAKFVPDALTAHSAALAAITEPQILDEPKSIYDLQELGRLACKIIERLKSLNGPEQGLNYRSTWFNIRANAAIRGRERRWLERRGCTLAALAETDPFYWEPDDSLCPSGSHHKALLKANKCAGWLQRFLASADPSLVAKLARIVPDLAVWLDDLYSMRLEIDHLLGSLNFQANAVGRPRDERIQFVASAAADTFNSVTGKEPARRSAPDDADFEVFLGRVFDALDIQGNTGRRASHRASAERALRSMLERDIPEARALDAKTELIMQMIFRDADLPRQK